MSHDLKVAVLFSGLPRGFKGTIRRNPWLRKVDVFMHGWHKTGAKVNEIHPSRELEIFKGTDLAQLKILYRPKAVKLENPESWSIDGAGILPSSISKHYPWAYGRESQSFLDQMLSNNISMWTSIYRSWKAFEEFQEETGKRYDVVIRARYDIFPKINFDWIETAFRWGEMVLPDTNHPINMLNDWFAMGNEEQLKSYCSLIETFDQIFYSVQAKRSSWCNEYGLYEHLKNEKIPFKVLQMEFE
jgi:hypothetical protein